MIPDTIEISQEDIVSFDQTKCYLKGLTGKGMESSVILYFQLTKWQSFILCFFQCRFAFPPMPFSVFHLLMISEKALSYCNNILYHKT